MSATADRRRQGRLLVRLRAVRMEAAARALAEARAATARAKAERDHADEELHLAEQRHVISREELIEDPQQAERRLAIADQAAFRRAVSQTALDEAQAAERACAEEETLRRKAMLVAHARHEIMEGQADCLDRVAARSADERANLENEDTRRFR